MADEQLTATHPEEQADVPARPEPNRAGTPAPQSFPWPDERNVQAIGWRIRVIYGVAVLLSVVWFCICFTYVQKAVGWGNLFELQPAEFGGVAGAAFLPLAILWLIVAFLDRGSLLRIEAAQLRRHLDLLVYPADDSEARLATVTATLRRQAADLAAASDQAMAKAEQVGAMVTRHTEALEKVAERFGGDSQRVIDSLQTEIQTLGRHSVGTVERVSELRDATAALSLAAEDAAGRAQDFTTTMQSEIESLDGTAKRVTMRAEEVGLHLQHSADGLGRAVATAGARIDDMVRTVAVQGELIVATSDKAAGRAEEVTAEINR